ncbi:hypothetical protein ABFT23_00485 [Nocardioides sp. C4-1]|uniref:hypothetical protein n=1 Tax=Nocardioides sp. C4-1 TaxID=3151851 RepID=UPI003267CFD2
MKVRVLLATFAALAVGAAGGWALAADRDDDEPAPSPESVTVAPVPAEPSVPVDVVQPDPTDEPLAAGIELTPEEVLSTPGPDDTTYQLTLPLPTGWTQNDLSPTQWTYTVPGNSKTSYVLRVEIIAAEGMSVANAVIARKAELDSAVDQGNMRDLDVELFPTDDGFEATYLDSGGYRRVSVERWFAGPDGTAFATVGAVGREVDRVGLRDLVNRITRDKRTAQKP